jgi:hypothetical protein
LTSLLLPLDINFKITLDKKELSMKKSLIAVSIIAAGLLVLVIACQQPEKKGDSSGWRIAPAPSTAAGYGAPPLSPAVQEETPPVAPTGGYGYGASPPSISESVEQQPSTGGYGSQPPSSTIKIEPPPAAGGYGKGQ